GLRPAAASLSFRRRGGASLDERDPRFRAGRSRRREPGCRGWRRGGSNQRRGRGGGRVLRAAADDARRQRVGRGPRRDVGHALARLEADDRREERAPRPIQPRLPGVPGPGGPAHRRPSLPSGHFRDWFRNLRADDDGLGLAPPPSARYRVARMTPLLLLLLYAAVSAAAVLTARWLGKAIHAGYVLVLWALPLVFAAPGLLTGKTILPTDHAMLILPWSSLHSAQRH